MNPDITQALELPESYTIRPTTLVDAEAVCILSEIVNKANGLQSQSDPDDLRNDWQEPKFDLTSSSRVILDTEGQVIGYCTIWDTASLPVKPWFAWQVHPEHFGKGLEDYLLNWMEKTALRVIERCPEDAQIKFQTNSIDKADYRIEFIEGMGYSHSRNFYRMLIEMDEAPPQAILPGGIIIRAIRYPDELEALVKADDAAFQDHWGYIPRPIEEELEQWKHWIETDRLFDSSLFFLAIDNKTDEIAGICLCRIEQHDNPENAYIDSLGVLRNYRRKGLALALLNHSFGELWRRGKQKVALHVDASSLTGATRLYEKAGMHADETWMSFQKIIREGVDLSTTSVE
jgi:mycothiol synthase